MTMGVRNEDAWATLMLISYQPRRDPDIDRRGDAATS